MNKYILFALLILLSYTSVHAKDKISLQTTKYSMNKECRNISKLHPKDNLNTFKKFSIADNDYLTVSLLSDNLLQCYFFKYYPEISQSPQFSIKQNNLIIIESAGSTLGGNSLTKIFFIDSKKKNLRGIQSKYSSFSTDENGNVHEVTSNE